MPVKRIYSPQTDTPVINSRHLRRQSAPNEITVKHLVCPLTLSLASPKVIHPVMEVAGWSQIYPAVLIRGTRAAIRHKVFRRLIAFHLLK